MSNNNDNVRFTISLPPDLNASLESDAKDKAQTKAALVRMIIAEHYNRQMAEWRAHYFAPDQVPATP